MREVQQDRINNQGKNWLLGYDLVMDGKNKLRYFSTFLNENKIDKIIM